MRMKQTVLFFSILTVLLQVFSSCSSNQKHPAPTPLLSPYSSDSEAESFVYRNSQSKIEKEIESDEERNEFDGYYQESIKGKIVGLALGGGGAKAAAEIGVLKVLEEAGVRPDIIVGSSMGAVVGGLYAAGYSAAQLENLLMTEEWLSLFDKDKIGPSVEDEERTVFGVIRGESFENHLRDALRRKRCINIEDTKKINHIAFACTATSIVAEYSLSAYNLKSGDMAKSMRASMTYPAPIVGFDPVPMNGMMLVDGGMLNNLPVNVVKEMGADIIIAVDLERDNKNELKLDFVIPKLGWLGNWLKSHPERPTHNINYNMADIKINPILKSYSILSFNEEDYRRMIELGEDAAKDHWHKLVRINK